MVSNQHLEDEEIHSEQRSVAKTAQMEPQNVKEIIQEQKRGVIENQNGRIEQLERGVFSPK